MFRPYVWRFDVTSGVLLKPKLGSRAEVGVAVVLPYPVRGSLFEDGGDGDLGLSAILFR